MGDRNPPTFANASRRYTALRRRYWRFLFGGVTLFAVPGTALIAFGPQQRFVFYELLVRILQIGFVVCCLGCLIQWHCLMQFICPRCGMRFVMSQSRSWPASTCTHCGLNLEMVDKSNTKSAYDTPSDDW